MKRDYSLEEMKSCFDAGMDLGRFVAMNNYFDKPLDFDEFIESINKVEVEEDTIPITLGHIRNTCGWSRYCDITGSNHYMLKEFSVSDREIFDVKKSDAEKLGLI
jgi:hypothetical protein